MRYSWILLAFSLLVTMLLCVYLQVARSRVESSQIENGIVAFKEGHYTCAALLLSPYADGSDPGVAVTLGTMYALGLGVPRNRSKALKLFRSSPDHYIAEAGTYLWIAQTLERGQGVAADQQEASAWYQIAATAGSKEAKEHLKSMATAVKPSRRGTR